MHTGPLVLMSCTKTLHQHDPFLSQPEQFRIWACKCTKKFLVTALLDQNSFNVTSNNPETLIIQNLRRTVPRPRSFTFYHKKSFINETGNVYGQVQKASKSVPYSNFFSYEDTRKQERKLMTLNQKMKDMSKWSTAPIGYTDQI